MVGTLICLVPYQLNFFPRFNLHYESLGSDGWVFMDKLQGGQGPLLNMNSQLQA